MKAGHHNNFIQETDEISAYSAKTEIAADAHIAHESMLPQDHTEVTLDEKANTIALYKSELVGMRQKIESLILRRESLKADMLKLREELGALQAAKAAVERDNEEMWLKRHRALCQRNDAYAYIRLMKKQAHPKRFITPPSPPILNSDAPIGGTFSLPELSCSMQNVEKFISFRYGLIYIPVPKVASQTMFNALMRYHRSQDDYLFSAQSLDSLFQEFPKTRHYFRFSVVRHPFTRCVSCYLDKLQNITLKKNAMFLRSGISPLPESFAEFISMLNGESGEDRSANAHWGRQIALLTDSEGAWHIHAVARLENLEADIAAIFQQRGLPSLCFTKFKNRRESYQNPNESVFYTDNEFYWSAANEANILIRYAEDYARLNYQPFALQAQLL